MATLPAMSMNKGAPAPAAYTATDVAAIADAYAATCEHP